MFPLHARRFVRALLLALLAIQSAALIAQELYFEAPAEFARPNQRFPQSGGTRDLAVIAYQSISSETSQGGVIDVVLRSSTDGVTWTNGVVVAEGIVYEGQSIPPVYSLAVSRDGAILVAVTRFEKTSDDEGLLRIVVHRSSDRGETFSVIGEAVSTGRSLVVPKLVQRADGGWMLLFEYVYEGSDSRLVYTRSDNGAEWDHLRVLPVDNRLENQVDAAHTAIGDRDVLVFSGENFAALNAGFDENANPISPLAATFHLMSAWSEDGGLSWTAVDPATGRASEPRLAPPLDEFEQSTATQISVTGEDLPEGLIPYWYLQVDDAGAPEYGVPEYGDIVSRRPDVVVHDGRGYVAWEAGVRRDTDATRQVVVAEMTADGNLAGPLELLSADGLTRARATVAYNQPVLASLNGALVVAAYNDPTRRGEVVLYQEGPFGWRETRISRTGIATFAAVLVHSGRLHVFWQQRPGADAADRTSIVHLKPDQSALPPRVAGANFTTGARSRSSIAELVWTAAPDASGIAGYSYVWSRDPDAPVPTAATVGLDERSASFTADADGEWYFRIRAVDRAGNWSEPGTTVYFRDTTPPGRVQFLPPALDEDGYLASNTFALRWQPPSDDIVAGYSYDLVYVDRAGAEIDVDELPVPQPPARLMTSESIVRQENYDNGLWAFTVTAIDSVGNIGEPAVLYVRMNKYIPVTLIRAVIAIPDALGRYGMEIVGRGFLANGRIVQLILDRDRRPPYDYVYGPGSPGFRIYDDRNMSGPLLDNIETGTYWLGLVHEERGLTFASDRLVLEQNGTVKFGDFTVRPGVEFGLRAPGLGFVRSVGALAWAVIALLAAIVVLSAARIGVVTRDGILLRLEARALVAGKPLPSGAQEKRIADMRKRGIGLRAKFAFLIVVLIMAVVAMLAVGLGTATLNNQRRILLRGLNDRVAVLMESIVAGATTLLPEPEINIVALTELPSRTRAMDEALYATITGEASAAAGQLPEPGHNYVWSTNDPVIREVGDIDAERQAEIDASALGDAIERLARTGTGEDLFVAGSTRVQDPISDLVNELARDIDSRAREALGELPLAIEAKFQAVLEQTTTLATTTFESAEARSRAQQNLVLEQLRLAALNEQLDTILSDIVGRVRSYPEFDPETYSEDQRAFIFYQPVTYPEAVDEEGLASARYVRGVVRIGVSTDLIIEEIAEARFSIIRITALIALAAIAAGIAGALILATIVVIPINRLVRGVEMIRDTQDKEELANHQITVRSKDELYALATTINSMTEGLVAGAQRAKALGAGKEVQQMFIPLEKSEDGKSLTTGKQDTELVEFFGYYLGADELSGDYFFYQDLGEGMYAVIKCDVSGHGVPAALIMVEVATVFLSYFRDWRLAGRKPSELHALVETINDLVNAREFPGKFAALTVAILNGTNGRCQVSHAGDRELRIYRAQALAVELNKMGEAPAAGPFPTTFLPAGFPQHSYTLAAGDVLLLPTDGIEESMRAMRDEQYRPVIMPEDELKGLTGTFKRDDESGIVYEQLNNDRIETIIRAVGTGGQYTVKPYMDPGEPVVFDYKGLRPTAENIVYAIIAAERMWRIVPDPRAGQGDVVQVEANIDEFLRSHLKDFGRYFRHRVAATDEKPGSLFVTYSHLKEDRQEDDLTILAIRKK